MKTTDFIKENKFIGDDARAMHQDHEVQMARSDCYNAAKYAIELHKLLKNISEMEGLDGWVSEKITLANDYLRTVAEYLRHEQLEKQTQMPEVFTAESAEAKFAALLNEFAPSMGGGDDGDDGFDEDTLRQLAAKWYNGDEDPAVERILMAAGWEIGQDEGYEDEPGVFVVMSGDEHGKTYMSWPAEDLRSGMAEALSGQPGFWSSPPESDIETFGLQKGRPYQINSPQDFKPGDRKRAKQQLIPTQDKKDHIRSRLGKHVAPVLPEQGVTESRPDVMRHAGDTTIRVVKKGGRPIGEIGIDAEASEGNGQYYVKLYDGSYDAVGFDTAEEALAELKYAVKQSIAETTSAGGIATVPGVGGGKTAGTLFGGSYSPKTPFTAKKKAKESVIKR